MTRRVGDDTQAQATAGILGDELYKRFPWAHFDCNGSSLFALPTTTDPTQALLKRTWEPTLSVTGAGLPRLSAHEFSPLTNSLRPPFMVHMWGAAGQDHRPHGQL